MPLHASLHMLPTVVQNYRQFSLNHFAALLSPLLQIGGMLRSFSVYFGHAQTNLFYIVNRNSIRT